MADSGLVAAAVAAGATGVALVNRVADAVGGVAAPWQIQRMAKAQAAAAIIVAESEVEVTELQRRAGQRLIEEEARKQENMENILAKALPHVDEEGASPEKIEEDWITNFFEKGRLISDSEIQQLWSRILAGEANAPGSFSRKTINTLEDLSREDLRLFLVMCRFVWTLDGHPVPVLAQSPEETNKVVLYHANGVDFIGLHYLQDLGLIRFKSLGNFVLSNRDEIVVAVYFQRKARLGLPPEKEGSLNVGFALFTREGEQLWKAFGRGVEPIAGFYEHMHEVWAKDSLVLL